jgi:hypothetical protein
MEFAREVPSGPEPSQGPPVARDKTPAFNEAHAFPPSAPCGATAGKLKPTAAVLL